MELEVYKKQAILRAIELAIRERGLNPTRVAAMLGAQPSWLTRILKGERGMDLFDFIKITEVLGTTPQEILKDFPPEPASGAKPNSKEVAETLNQLIPADVMKRLMEMNRKKP